MSSPLRLALVGLGGHGRTIQDAVARHPDLSVRAVFDPNETEAQAAAERFGCPAATSYEALLATGDLDAVALVTPNSIHRAQTEAALEAGLDVFVEKPIANTVADGRAMIEAAERAGRVLMVGHNIRWGGAARTAKAWLDEGRIGEVVNVEIHYAADNIQKGSHEGWRFQPGACPLLPMMQLGIHAIDLVHYLLAPITEVYARTRTVLAPSGIVDQVTAHLTLADGRLGSAVSTYCTPDLFEIRLAGTKGILEVGWIPHRLVLRTRGARTEEPEVQTFGAHGAADQDRQWTAFVEAVRSREAPETSGPVGLQALAVVEAMARSAEQGVAVKVER